MSDKISRDNDSAFAIRADTLANIANSTPVDFSKMAGGEIHVPAGSAGLTMLTWYTSHDGRPENYVPAKKEADGTGVTVAVDGTNGGGYPVPADLFGCHFLKAVGNVAADLRITLKG
jgi:hypothetical protein